MGVYYEVSNKLEMDAIVKEYGLDFYCAVVDEGETLLKFYDSYTCELIGIVDIGCSNSNPLIQWFEIVHIHKRKGYGRKIVNCLKQELAQEVDCIYAVPISEDAKKFWDEMGFELIQETGILKWSCANSH